MMIKINQSVLEERDNDLYETVRSAWKVNLNKAKQYKYCLNCISKKEDRFRSSAFHQEADEYYLLVTYSFKGLMQ